MKKILIVVLVMIAVFNLNLFNVYAGENEEKVIESEVICVDSMMNSRATVSVMEIIGKNLDFSKSWEKHYNLYYSVDDAIIGEIVCGYDKDTNKVYCKSYSNIYRHRAKITIANTSYLSSKAITSKWAQKSVTHNSAMNSSIHEFGIEMYDAYSGREYYFSIVNE